MKRKVLLFALTLLLLFAVSEVAAEDVCTDKADQAMENLRTWTDLRLWYENFPHRCDDGELAEGMSEFVVATLAKRWNTLPSLQAEIAKNRRFKHFVIEHIDATTDDGDLANVLTNARTSCPRSLGSLCKKIEKKAQTALKQSEEDRARQPQLLKQLNTAPRN